MEFGLNYQRLADYQSKVLVVEITYSNVLYYVLYHSIYIVCATRHLVDFFAKPFVASTTPMELKLGRPVHHYLACTHSSFH